jgi:hypothetical protein
MRRILVRLIDRKPSRKRILGMNEEDLNYLKTYAMRQARQLAKGATVSYDSGDGFITVEAITRAGDGQPRSVKRAAKYSDRAQAEAFIDDAIRAAR